MYIWCHDNHYTIYRYIMAHVIIINYYLLSLLQRFEQRMPNDEPQIYDKVHMVLFFPTCSC